MPRSRKTAAGTPAQPVEAMTGQQYGRARQQEALQQAMPTPQVSSPQIPVAPPQTISGPSEMPSQTPQVPQRMSPLEAIQMLRGQGGLLTAPDDNPAIPITDGLSTGPGRGREVRNTESALGDTLRRLAMQTNDPVFMELASKVSF